MSNEIVRNLEEKGWHVAENNPWHLGIDPVPHPAKTNSVYLFQKTFPQADNIDVVISIHPYEERFVVIGSAEHRTSGPNTTVAGEVMTLNEALVIAQSHCQYWEEWLENWSNNQKPKGIYSGKSQDSE
jgi:hypothetical protein